MKVKVAFKFLSKAVSLSLVLSACGNSSEKKDVVAYIESSVNETMQEDIDIDIVQKENESVIDRHIEILHDNNIEYEYNEAALDGQINWQSIMKRQGDEVEIYNIDEDENLFPCDNKYYDDVKTYANNVLCIYDIYDQLDQFDFVETSNSEGTLVEIKCNDLESYKDFYVQDRMLQDEGIKEFKIMNVKYQFDKKDALIAIDSNQEIIYENENTQTNDISIKVSKLSNPKYTLATLHNFFE